MAFARVFSPFDKNYASQEPMMKQQIRFSLSKSLPSTERYLWHRHCNDIMDVEGASVGESVSKARGLIAGIRYRRSKER